MGTTCFKKLAVEFFVGTTGADIITCSAESSPCQSVTYVLNNKVFSGDTIKILQGN